jgi:hypothetical protein
MRLKADLKVRLYVTPVMADVKVRVNEMRVEGGPGGPPLRDAYDGGWEGPRPRERTRRSGPLGTSNRLGWTEVDVDRST